MRSAGTAARPSGADLAGLAQPLGHREDGRQLDLDLLHAVVQLELQAEPAAKVLESLHAAGEGQAEELGQLRTDLARLAVERVATHQHEVVGAAPFQRGGQRPGRGQGVRTGEGLVADVEPAIGAPGDRLAQDVLGAGRPEGERRAAASRLAGERHAMGHGPAAVGVHLELEPVAHQAALLEAHRLGQRDLLGQRGDAQRAPRGPVRAAAHEPEPVRVSTNSVAGSSTAGV